MKRVLFAVVTGVAVLGIVEAASYTLARQLDRTSVFYRPAAPSRRAVEHYLAERDTRLGWPSPSRFGTRHFDESGSRRIPAFPEPGEACVSLYGDSFSYGSGVSDEAAVSNQLSLLFGCRVANYGVHGYGSDQALLRYESMEDDDAPVVVLTHLSENVVRNLNRYRRLIASGDPFSMKPRFILDEDTGLRLVPLLETRTPDDYLEVLRDPGARLEDEYFLPGGPSGVQRLRFPFSLRMLLSLRHYHVRAELRGMPFYAEFFEPDHPSQAVELTVRIFERFVSAASERGQRPLVQVLPTAQSLAEYRRSGRWVYAPLLVQARKRGLDVVDLGRSFAAETARGGPCEIYLGCEFHLNERGNALFALETARAIEERGLRPRSGGRARSAVSPGSAAGARPESSGHSL